MHSTPKRRGQKPKPYKCPWNNETIDGLYQCPDGRWRDVETGQKFTEPDPGRAVARFRRIQAGRRGSNALIPLPLLGPNTDADLFGAVEAVLRRELGTGYHRAPGDDSLVLHVPSNFDPVVLLRAVPEDVYTAHVAQDIIARPRYVAERTGIEQIGYSCARNPDDSSASGSHLRTGGR